MPGQPLTRAPGFFGKLPSRGDFVGRRLAPDFVETWDAWLKNAMAASQAALGGEWLDVYLTSPLWRFAVSPGVCGSAAHVGVVMPSVDRVGRYYPLAAAASLGAESAPLADAAALDDWYEAVEALLLETLAETPLDLEDFDARLDGLVPAGSATLTRDATHPRSGSDVPLRRHLRTAAAGPVCRALLGLCGAALEERAGPCSVWWTQGSDRMEPCMLIAAGLPEPAAFTAMLDGRWSERGWVTGELGIRRAEAGAGSAAGLTLRSAGVTDVGKVRAVNEDAYACRDDASMWLVADGLGGHESGDVASRMVAAALQQLDGGALADDAAGQAAGTALTRRVERLCEALRVVNACLRALVATDRRAGLVASTVAALLVDGGRAACVWAGDSRVYRLRHGVLEQLSRDHADAAGPSQDNRTVTRAVGGGAVLKLDVERFDVCDGDRYLLCTDGLYGEVGSAGIASALACAEPAEACARLKDAALAGDARDNLTAVVVHASRHGGVSGIVS